MGFRTVYGNQFSSNGWPMVDQGSCTWVDIPGTDPTVRIQIQNGPPLWVLRAFVADINAYVEHVRDNDTACWTEGNSVSTSNHLSGTAVDIDWDSHKFRVADAGWSPEQIAEIRRIQEFYEGIVFWGDDWTNPKDAMHFQLSSLANGGDINTFNNPHVQQFIDRKIRADGFSTYRRGGSTAPVPVDAAQILADATGLPLNRAQEIAGAVRWGLQASQATNVNRIAMWLAQIGHESGSFRYTEEIASGDESTDRWRYKGRTWIQITWRTNYAQFSKWCYDRSLVDSPTYFVDHPKELAQLHWAGLGAAWYWTVARADINALSDARDLETVTRRINGGLNGIDDRRSRYERALSQGDRLLSLLGGEDDMANVPQDQWDWVYNEMKKLFPSRAMYGGWDSDTLAGRAISAHGMAWEYRVESSALRGEQWAIQRVVEAAAGSDEFLSGHAKAVLAEIEQKNPAALEEFVKGKNQ